ncbi:hypothetical protein G7077_12655 [Sphingomonas piscis]|uniref:MarR family transcriptional regulator n=1 Tax=Sphingomonas piscis TaxID=2714943 RepID=A0A6G7YSA5_9SPHN|nr:hypothetical protein [Sphingomonas piscis]QIK79628.1 hypothetical protein G7077_12655 [Sphingomonas piscis]
MNADQDQPSPHDAGASGSNQIIGSSRVLEVALADRSAIFPEFALFEVARAIRELRKVRREHFGTSIPEAAWDMLLEIYFREKSGSATATEDLREVSDLPRSTTSRWLRYLEQEKWVRCVPPAHSAISSLVDLEPAAREAMHRYLTEVREFALKQPQAAL